MRSSRSRATRPRLAAVALALLSAVTLLAVTAAASAGASTHRAKSTAKASAPRVGVAGLAYDLVSANGQVSSFGHAGNYGGADGFHLAAPIVGMAATPDGRGYWLVGQDGGVFTFGDAHFFGSLGGKPHTSAHDIIGIVPSKDGAGYWLCDRSGIVTAFGDARPLPSLLSFKARLPIVGFSVLRSGKGGFVVNSNGDVFRLGNSVLYGNLRNKTGGAPIVAMTRSPSGHGYWLVNANGVAAAFGDATAAVPPPAVLAKKGPVVGITAAPGGGYWAVASTGYVVPGGVPSRGGLARRSGSTAIVGIDATVPILETGGGTYPAGTYGYDVNWPQCSASGSSTTGPMPGGPSYPAGTSAYTVAIVGVDGWAVDDYNSCLGAEASWASQSTLPGGSPAPHYQLYLFLNSPASTSTIDATGPAGTCSSVSSSARPACLAYNYGYNSAVDAVSYAASQGASATTWWLDIENDACAPGEWNDAAAGEWWSCDQSLDAETIQGALDSLRHDHLIAGVYSTEQQWDAITGTYSPTGGTLPIWIAGAPWTAPPYPSYDGYQGTGVLQAWCSGQYDFGGGTVEMLQETPGSNNYPYDPDYAC